jgi:BCD family chlorophyll transporter-like MFS transporter
LWKQEPRAPSRVGKAEPRPAFRASWSAFVRRDGSKRFLVAVGLGTAGFSMQDILLEPYGGQIMQLAVGATTTLTALLAGGTLLACAVAAHALNRGMDPYRLAAAGVVVGLFAFPAVILAAPLDAAFLFRVGTALIGFGGGLFAVGTLTAAMSLQSGERNGLALGAWGAVQASAAGGAIALGGVLRDVVSGAASQGLLGPALTGPATGYGFVYHIEIALLFAALVALGPLVRTARTARVFPSSRFELAEFPG